MTWFYYPSNRNTGKLDTEEFALLDFHDVAFIDFKLILLLGVSGLQVVLNQITTYRMR